MCVDSFQMSYSPVLFSVSVTSFYRAWWLSFSLYTWLTMSDFIKSPRITTFWCASILTFKGRLFFLFLITTAGNEIHTFLVMFSFKVAWFRWNRWMSWTHSSYELLLHPASSVDLLILFPLFIYSPALFTHLSGGAKV